MTSLGNMPLPDEDVAEIAGWVNARNAELPAHVATQLRYEMESYRNAVTLVEPTRHVGKLLDEIERDPTCIFFG